MKRLINRFRDRLNRNPYEEEYQRREEWLRQHINTPNLAKLAYYCGCDVDDLVNELKSVLYEVRP